VHTATSDPVHLIAAGADFGELAAKMNQERLRAEDDLLGSVVSWPWEVAADHRLESLRTEGITPKDIIDETGALIIATMGAQPDGTLLAALSEAMRTANPSRVVSLAERMPGPSGAPVYARRLRQIILREDQVIDSLDRARRLLTGELDPD
jgi:hypothetical protein